METKEIRDEIKALGKQNVEIEEKIKSLCEEYVKKTFPFETGQKVLVKDTWRDEYPAYFVRAKASYSKYRNEIEVSFDLKKVKKDGTMAQISAGYCNADENEIERGLFSMKPFE
jgi:hypothetical protein